MSTSGNPGDQQIAATSSSGGTVVTLPAELEEFLKPAKTPERIQHAITWASRRDPAVLEQHKALKHEVATFEDIQRLPLEQLDAVAQHFARAYRDRAFLTGAITGLPGGLWALVASGVDVQLIAVYAVRMASDVAQSYGYDTSMAVEQAHLAEVLALAAGVDSLRGVGNWLTREGLAHLLPELLPKIMMRLSVELTEEQAGKLVGRLIPGLGATVAGTIDYTFLRVAGERATEYYHNRYLVDHGLTPENPRLSLPARAFAAFTPQESESMSTASAQPPKVVEGSLGRQLQSATAVPAVAKKIPNRPPERRIRFWLTVFGVFFFFATVAALAALLVLIGNGVQNLMH